MTTIFDSGKADIVSRELDLPYYLSSGFRVPAGAEAHLLLTSSVAHFRALRFYFHRTPSPLLKSHRASCLTGVYTRLHEALPNEALPESGAAHERTTIVLGWNPYKQRHYDWLTVTRPGNYYLYAPMEHNSAICDLESPTLVELFIRFGCPASAS